VPTGRTFRRYVNPGIDVARDAVAVHGLSEEILRDEPPFAAIADELLAFLAESPLVIHNAEFDLGFLNAELARLERAPIPAERAIDTLLLARRRFPGAPANLDALCKRFAIAAGEPGFSDVVRVIFGYDPATKQLLDYAEKVTRYAYRVTDQDIAELRRVGWSDRQILEATVVAAQFNFINRIVDALGAELEPVAAEGRESRP